VDELLAREGLLIDQQSRDELADRIFWLKWTLYTRLYKRAEGDYSRDPQLDKFPAWTPPRASALPTAINKEAPAEKSGSANTLGSLFEAWKLERRPPERTAYEWKRVVDRLEKHLGPEADFTNITKRDMLGWRDALIRSGKSPALVKYQLDVARVLFGWAVRNDRLQVNPATGATASAKGHHGGAQTKRQPYSDADAKALLEAAHKETKGARRWVPWLLAFTGARLEEVCQAHVSDVKHEGGVWYLDINTNDPGKKLKNPGSARKVPLHPALIAEGFLEYLATVPRDGLLFPELKPDRFGKKGTYFSRWYSKWARSLGITDKRLVAHSWRHRFKDLCRAASVEKSIHDALTGHKSGDVGDSYGLGYPLKVLASAVAKLPAV
jgi:integrase